MPMILRSGRAKNSLPPPPPVIRPRVPKVNSAFTVISTKWGSGTDQNPHVIELYAAPDNKAEPENLPLAPWS